MAVEWARSIRDQSLDQDIVFFLKQLGGYPDKRHRLEQFPPDLRIQEFPET
jgi:protein gp37